MILQKVIRDAYHNMKFIDFHLNHVIAICISQRNHIVLFMQERGRERERKRERGGGGGGQTDRKRDGVERQYYRRGRGITNIR